MTDKTWQEDIQDLVSIIQTMLNNKQRPLSKIEEENELFIIIARLNGIIVRHKNGITK